MEELFTVSRYGDQYKIDLSFAGKCVKTNEMALNCMFNSALGAVIKVLEKNDPEITKIFGQYKPTDIKDLTDIARAYFVDYIENEDKGYY